MATNYEAFKDGGLKYALMKLKSKLDTLLSNKADKTELPAQATDSTPGLVKINTP